MKLEREAWEALESLEVPDHQNKEDIKLMMSKKKLERLKANYKKLRKQEVTALSLIKRPDFERLLPTLVPVAPKDKDLWAYCRHVVSSAPYNGRLGRRVFLWCMDQRTKGILGIVELNADYNMLGLREKAIGWDVNTKYKNLKYICNIGSCVGTAPFGAVVGGKFQIVAVTTKEARGWWQNRYGDPVVVMTTTSLYGKSSIYNRIKEFRYLGVTPGQGAVSLTKEVSGVLTRFIKANNLMTRAGGFNGMQIHGELDMILKVCNTIKFPLERVSTKAPKGIYMAECGEGSIDYLAGRRQDWEPNTRTLKDVQDWWLDRWYSMRLPKVRETISNFDWSQYSLDYQMDTIQKKVARDG